MNLKRKVASGLKWTTLSTIILTVVALLKISVLTRFLDKSDFGLMALVTFVMGFMNLFNDMGLTSAILHKQSITKKEYASLYWFNFFFSIILFSLLVVITPLVAKFYNQEELNVLIPLFGLNLIISGLGRMFKTMEQKCLVFKYISIIDVFSGLVSLIFAIYLAINNYGVFAIVYSSILQFLLGNTLYLYLGLKKYGLLFHFKFTETRPFLKIGIYQVGGQIINYFNRDLDILIIGKMFDTDVLGGYSLAKQLVMRPVQILNPVLSKVASPTLAKFQSNVKLLRSNYLKLINIVSTINIPIYFIVIIFAHWIVELLYGEGFENIVIIVRILSVYMIMRSINSPVGSLVIATGRTDLEFYWNFLTLFISPICIYIGAQYGIVGAAIGITFSMLILFVPAWKLLINKMTGATLKEYTTAIFRLRFKSIFQVK